MTVHSLFSMAALDLFLWYFGLINVLTFAVFVWDKICAARGLWRVQEATLLACSFAGGWFGAKLAQRLVRHKTRKQPFAKRLNTLPIAWLGIACIAAAVHFAPLDLFSLDQEAGNLQTPGIFQSASQ